MDRIVSRTTNTIQTSLLCILLEHPRSLFCLTRTLGSFVGREKSDLLKE